jgi:rRNA-processing protein FCF1
MPYLLDGNNLIGIARKTSRPGEEDRRALIAEVADRLRATRARATIFFDGSSGGRGAALGTLTVAAGTGGSADDAIVREVERARAPGELTVVTADRELTRRVRNAGGKVVSPTEFFRRFGKGMTSGATAGAGGGPVDIEDWLRYFEDESNRS